MEETIIWILVCWACAAVFLGIGIYARKREKPMWFWSGSTVSEDSISDIPAYNKENGRMWIIYSVPFWFSGILYIFAPLMATNLVILDCTIGMAWLVWTYYRIKKRYRCK